MQRNKRLLRVVIISIALLSFFIYLSIKIIEGAKQLNKDFEANLPSTYTFEDSNLIARKFWPEINVNEIARNKLRNPVSLLVVDKKFNLIIYKLTLQEDRSLNQIISFNRKKSFRSSKYSYRVIGNNIPFHFDYKGGEIHPVREVHLAIWGDSISQEITSDSIVSYRFLIGNMSLTYDSENGADILVEGKEELFGMTTTIPMNLLFRKRGRDLYLFLLK